MACGLCEMRTEMNPALASANVTGALMLRSLSGLSGDGDYGGEAGDPVPVSTGSGSGVDWTKLSQSTIDLAKQILIMRPPAGTVITQGANGQIQVARGADGQPINYSASNTQVGGGLNAGLGLGLQSSGVNTSVLVIGGLALVALVLVLKR